MKDHEKSAPVVERQWPFAWFTDDYLTDKSSTTYDELTSARWKDKGWSVQPLFREQPAQAVTFSKGFTTFESGNGKYQIVTSYPNRDDAWADYEALCKAPPELAELQATIDRMSAEIDRLRARLEAVGENQ